MQEITVVLAFLIVTMSIVAPALQSASAASFSVTNRSQHPITMTCASKNDHLGTHVLSIGDERDWHFGGLPWTKFWCEFYKSDGKYLKQVTWSFFLDFFHISSMNFNWALKEAGIFLENGSNEQLFKGWNEAPTNSKYK